jgi:hypothetical protein
MKLTFIGFETPSGNKFHKRHWSVYAKFKRECIMRACNAFATTGYHHEGRKLRVKFTCYRKRLLDDDNLRSGLKAFRDALIVAGFIKDDSPRWGEFEYQQFTVKCSPWNTCALVVEIEPA